MPGVRENGSRARVGPVNDEMSVIRLHVSGSRNDEARLLTLLEELERLGRIERDAIADAWFLHDEWCAVWHGHPCNCNAAIEISVRRPEKRGTEYATFPWSGFERRKTSAKRGCYGRF
jgi:hypothetical protein